MQERLQKIISRAGVASRRHAEELILQGLVTVNGQPVTELGSKADPAKDSIKVRGKVISGPAPEKLYLMLNKPKGYVVTKEDPEGRSTVMELLGKLAPKVYPIGRLDFWSEGLLLFTNDGDFANHVLAAKTEIPKTYQVKANAALTKDQLDKFRKGVVIDGRRTATARIRILRAGANPWYEVQLIEGRNRQIRKMFLALGVLVEKIRRVSVGPLHLGKLAVGQVRELTDREVERMQAMWAPDAKKRPAPERKPDAAPRPRPRPAAKKSAKKVARKAAKRASRERTPDRGRRPVR